MNRNETHRESEAVTRRDFVKTTAGLTARYESGDGKDNIGFWTDPNEAVTWQFEVIKPGRYEVVLSQACPQDTAGAAVDIRVGSSALKMHVKATSGWTDFAEIALGEVEIVSAGMCEVRVEPRSKPALAVMNLRSISLRPAPARAIALISSVKSEEGERR